MKAADKHSKIIHAATKVFAKKGFFNARISDIAKEAKVADGTIYLYFNNKFDILISVFEAEIGNLVTQVKKLLDAENCRRFSDVIGPRLKRQSPDGQRRPVFRAAEIIQNPFGKSLLLVYVYLLDCPGYRHLNTVLGAGMNQRPDVFREAGAAVTDTRKHRSILDIETKRR